MITLDDVLQAIERFDPAAVEPFKANVEKQGTMRELLDYIEQNQGMLLDKGIDVAFDWKKTAEGSAYWNRISVGIYRKERELWLQTRNG